MKVARRKKVIQEGREGGRKEEREKRGGRKEVWSE
jgi:hypothetical protein